MKRDPITTHILDTARGCPAAGVSVTLSRRQDGVHTVVGESTTDSDGRIMCGLIPPSQFRPGVYEIRFAMEPYYRALGVECFFPDVTVAFLVQVGSPHYHVPLLVSPFGYSTYRGS
ncbi:MAG: hydroxyisourate hydrolase [Planctomycetota bacterium]